jgi:hypothetical protein
MANTNKHENLGTVGWSKQFVVLGYTNLSGSSVAPFTSPRGDIQSSSHVIGSNLRLGDTRSADSGVWQFNTGSYVIVFPASWPSGPAFAPIGAADAKLLAPANPLYNRSDLHVNHALICHSSESQGLFVASDLNSVSQNPAGWVGYTAKDMGTFLTGSNPFKAAANNAAAGPYLCAGFAIFSGSNGVPVDPPFDFTVRHIFFFDLSDGSGT